MGQTQKPTLQGGRGLQGFASMFKKRMLPGLAMMMTVVGCTTTFTNLTPQTQERTTNNLYRVEVAIQSRQQTMRWESIKPQVVVGTDFYPMTPTKLMTN